MMYKKYTRMDPVVANRKFYRKNPNLVEFAKAQPILSIKNPGSESNVNF